MCAQGCSKAATLPHFWDFMCLEEEWVNRVCFPVVLWSLLQRRYRQALPYKAQPLFLLQLVMTATYTSLMHLIGKLLLIYASASSFLPCNFSLLVFLLIVPVIILLVITAWCPQIKTAPIPKSSGPNFQQLSCHCSEFTYFPQLRSCNSVLPQCGTLLHSRHLCRCTRQGQGPVTLQEYNQRAYSQP